MTLSGATTLGQSGTVSDSSEEVVHIPQSFSFTPTSPVDCLLSFVRGVLPLSREALVYSTAPTH